MQLFGPQLSIPGYLVLLLSILMEVLYKYFNRAKLSCWDDICASNFCLLVDFKKRYLLSFETKRKFKDLKIIFNVNMQK